MKFSSNKQSSEVINASKVTVLSLGFELKGDIISKNDIRADGILEGNIRTDKRVVVGEKAYIKGDIIADEISISGEVVGNLYINGETVIYSSAKVSGNILTNQIFIHKGAILNTSIRTADAETIKLETESSTVSQTSEKEYEVLLNKVEKPKPKTLVSSNGKIESNQDTNINESFNRSW